MLIKYYSANTNDNRMSNYVFVFSILALVEDNSCYWLEPLFTISSYGHNALYKQNIHPYKLPWQSDETLHKGLIPVVTQALNAKSDPTIQDSRVMRPLRLGDQIDLATQ